VTDLVPAVGGTRLVPAPDPVARDYITLALRLDQHIPGLVDGYFGPADLKATVDMEQRRAPARLRDDAIVLRERLGAEVADPDRRAWLDAQLVALETQAGGLAGETLPYLDYVARAFAYTPPLYPDSIFEAAAGRIAELLPGDAPLADRLADWDARFVVPVDRLQGVVDWLVARFREQAAADFGLPDGEDLRVSVVTGQPWSAYNWFDGGRRSRVDVNTDLPVRASDLIGLVAHETYPGHHLEHAWKEADLVDAHGRLESSIILINTPECLISEGLADIGVQFASPLEGRADLLIEVFERAGLSFAADPGATREVAEISIAISLERDRLSAISGNAAIRRHVDGRSHDEVAAYLRDVGRYPAARAEKALEIIEDPLLRTYYFAYAEGEAVLRRWLEAVAEPERAARFGRLLHEQLTPAAVTVPG
jgi:hypothetical protein